MNWTEDEGLKTMLNNVWTAHEKLILPYGHEWTCAACGYNAIKKHELTKVQRKNKLHQSFKVCWIRDSLCLFWCKEKLQSWWFHWYIWSVIKIREQQVEN